MSKIARDRLARGTKLMPSHTHGVLEDTSTELLNSRIEVEQLENSKGTFRVNLWIPWMAEDFTVSGDFGSTIAIPFCMPPIQEEFAIATDALGVRSPTINDDTPTLRLKEFSFSHDQRGEAGAIVSQYRGGAGGNAADRGKISFDDTEFLDIRVSLVEKTQHFFDADNLTPDREIFSADLPPDAYIGHRFRLNPFVITDIDQDLNPFRTYILMIGSNEFHNQTVGREVNFISICISMVIETDLVQRDTGATVFNIPTKHSGTKTPPTFSPILIPSPGNDIDADGGYGVAEQYATIDQIFRDKLDGGYDAMADVPPEESLQEDSCYEMIAVPLFSNRWGGGIHGAAVSGEPYINIAFPATDPLYDRRIIPLEGPFIIHHVIMAVNWQLWTNQIGGGQPAQVSASANFTLEVGLGLLTGIRADNFAYEQLAGLTISAPRVPATWDTHLIDRIRTRRTNPTRGVFTGELWDMELHEVPINPANPTTGSGYFADQGAPVFVGSGWTGTNARQGAPVTAGQEQVLEVRVRIQDAVAGLNGNVADIMTGYQGMWVYILGKKPTRALRWDRRP